MAEAVHLLLDAQAIADIVVTETVAVTDVAVTDAEEAAAGAATRSPKAVSSNRA